MFPSMNTTSPSSHEQRADAVDHHRGMSGLTEVIVRAIFRIFQFVFAILVAGLYGVDLHRATQSPAHAQASWIYAEVVAALSILTCIVHCFVRVKGVAWELWDFLLCILWTAQFGYFASLYLPQTRYNREHDFTGSVKRMKAAVWVDLVDMLLWYTTFVQGIVWCCSAHRPTRKTDTPGKKRKHEVDERLRDDETDQSSIEVMKRREEGLASSNADQDQEKLDLLPSYRQALESWHKSG